jgi:hypothetical protein
MISLRASRLLIRACAYKIKGKKQYIGMVFQEGAMNEEQSRPMIPLMTYFSVIRHPRIKRNKLYPLHEVIVITILAVIAMAQGWENIERHGKAKRVWLGKFLSLERFPAEER